MLALTAGPSSAQPKRRRPNVLLFLADDVGWADVGFHHPEVRTPNLDRLSEAGVRFDRFYVQPQCTPTRVALLTGRYPSRFGSHCTQASNDRACPFGTLTMASMLKSGGYDTALIGKWHLGSRPEWGPNHYGFDYSYGSLAGAVGMYDHRYRLNTPYAQTWHRNHEFIDDDGHSTDCILREATAWLRREREAPFFLYVPFHAAHTPLVEEEKWRELNAHIADPDRRLMAAAITHMDWAVGEILKTLDDLGQREHTLVIFISDNGGINGAYPGRNYPEPDPPLKAGFSKNIPLRGGKTDVYEGGMRVPALAHWPGVLEPCVVDAPVHAVDWMPTLAALADCKSEDDPQWDGRDQWAVIQGESPSKERVLYWVWGKGRKAEAIRQGDWKLLRNRPGKKWELFDLADDPYEKHDLAAAKSEKVAELKALLKAQKAKDKLPPNSADKS